MKKMQKLLGIIPARFESSRFPGKPLALIDNKPMVQWVYEGCSGLFDYLLVATDDQRIKSAVKNFGGNVMMTSNVHTSGTERCLEVVEKLDSEGQSFEFIINIQGDEPLIRKEQLQELIACIETENTGIATLVKKIDDAEDPSDPNIVKVVINKSREALLFSRSPIPYYRNHSSEKHLYMKHIGLYAFHREVLKEICRLPASGLEEAESLEQLRWLENGFSIKTALTTYRNISVDTTEDLEKVNAIVKNSQQTQ